MLLDAQGWNLIRREVVDSTSTQARLLVAEGRERLPLVVWAENQTAGRGRGTNLWWSDSGSLTFTLAIDPAPYGLRTEHEPRLALATAVALVDTIEPLAPSARLGIRWPNDIEAGGLKLGGILPERVDTATGPRLLVGIGLNVCTNLADAPADIQRMATSIEALRADTAELRFDELLAAILPRFEAAARALARDDAALADRWRLLDTLAGQRVRVRQGSAILSGQALGIDPDGSLRVLTPSGTTAIQGGQVLRDA